jgi:hypothetical protein
VTGDVTFLSVTVQLSPSERGRSDAFGLAKGKGQVLLTCCEIVVVVGGDGLSLTNLPRVHIHQTDISLAQNRGIFANNRFVIEDSAISNCGGCSKGGDWHLHMWRVFKGWRLAFAYVAGAQRVATGRGRGRPWILLCPPKGTAP